MLFPLKFEKCFLFPFFSSLNILDKVSEIEMIVSFDYESVMREAAAVASAGEFDDISITSEMTLKRRQTRKGTTFATEMGASALGTAQAEGDIVPAVYEGGLKVWECAVALAAMAGPAAAAWKSEHGSDPRVLELGCGHALAAAAALKTAGCAAYCGLADYNSEVVRGVSAVNVCENVGDVAAAVRDMRLYAGDWHDVAVLLRARTETYDLILCSDTVYREELIAPLLEAVEAALGPQGVCLCAGRRYYFGCGGGTASLCAMIDKYYANKLVWERTDIKNNNVQRETIRITRK